MLKTKIGANMFIKLCMFLGVFLILQNSLFPDDFTQQQKGNVTAYTNNNDVVTYTNHRNDKQFLADLKKSYNGLNNEEKVNELLKQQNYTQVLNTLWTEPNVNKKIAWLEKKVNNGDPLLMFELGAAYYDQNPTLETYVNQTMPWFLAGARRTLIDSACTSDESVSAAPDFLLMVYQNDILTDLRKQYSQQQIEKYFADHSKEFQRNSLGMLKKVMQPFVNGQEGTMPSPRWVYSHGLNAYLNTKNTIPDDQCAQIRKTEAEKFLKQAQEIENSL